MRAFHFRLARLLHLREAEKRQRALELAQKRQKFDEEQRALREELHRREETTGSYRGLSRRPAAAAFWLGAKDAMRLCELRVARQANVTRAALDAVDHARDLLVEKSREVETYHRLRTRQQAEHEQAAHHEEQKGHDEVATQRFNQQRRNTHGDERR